MVLENQGTLAWAGGGMILGGTPSGTLGCGAHAPQSTPAPPSRRNLDNQINLGVGTTAFDNAGLFEKTAGSGATTISVNFQNTGTVKVDTGTLDLDRGGSSDAAAFTVAAAATLLFTTGSFAMTGGNYDATGNTVVNSGTADFSAVPTADFDAGLTVSSGTMDLDTAGTSSIGSSLNLVSGGTVNFGGQDDSIPALTMSTGNLSGTGTLTVPGGASLVGFVDLMAGSGTTVRQGASSLNPPRGALSLDGGRVLENQGTLAWAGGGMILGGTLERDLGPAAARSVHDAGATIGGAIGQPDQSKCRHRRRSTTPDLFEKTAGSGATTISVNFQNTGTVKVDTGSSLDLDRGGSSGRCGLHRGGGGDAVVHDRQLRP